MLHYQTVQPRTLDLLRELDFLDIATILVNHTLSEMFTLYQRKFSVTEIAFALRGLTYYDDAESDPMPIMFTDLTWPAAKERISQRVREFVIFENTSQSAVRIDGSH